MWFSGLYAIGAVIGIATVAAGFGTTSMGGMPVTREHWLDVAAPIVGVIAVLMGLTAVGLRAHRSWARWTCMCIWPFIAASGVAAAIVESIPWWLARQAVIDAAVAGLIAGWVLFRHRASVMYFYRVRQARGGSSYRR